MDHGKCLSRASSKSRDANGFGKDNFAQVPTNVSTIADILNLKGISYGEYQEHMPYAGFQGFNYSNQETYDNDYVRKHSPLVTFESFTSNDTALRLLKNFTSFYDDLHKKELPQWAFITPSKYPGLVSHSWKNNHTYNAPSPRHDQRRT